MKKIVTIGGGTGAFNLLLGLKKYDYDISAIVSMADSGGSNKVICDEFGLLPTSDVRQCMVALAEDSGSGSEPLHLDDHPRPSLVRRGLRGGISMKSCSKNAQIPDSQNLIRKLFMYRFDKGRGIKGMTFGNLFMAALTDILGNQIEAIRKTGDILKIKGRVIPVTSSNSDLAAVYENGLKIKGEHFIDEPEHNGKLKIEKIYLDPPSIANPEAIRTIRKADLIIIGPGDLYTSLMVNFVVDGIAEAIKNTKAKIAYIANIMTSFGETYGFKASDHIKVVESYMLGRKLDYVLLNSADLPEDILKKYEKENEFPVEDDLEDDGLSLRNLSILQDGVTNGAVAEFVIATNVHNTLRSAACVTPMTKHASPKIIRADLISGEIVKKDKSDALKRSLIRHDGDKIARIIDRLRVKQFN